MKIKKTNESFDISFGFAHMIIGTFTSMVGYHIHHSIFFAVMDWIFFPLVWIKWFIYHEVTLNIIKETFAFFFN
jgi:hypothetical protein